MNTEPDASEWADEIDGEFNIDVQMKVQTDEPEVERVGSK